MTANTVIASEARYTPVRQRERTRKRMAEISVPAWPMPIQNTKVTMYTPHMVGCVMPATPMPQVSCWYQHQPP